MITIEQLATRYYVKAKYEVDTNLTAGLALNLNYRGGSTFPGSDYTIDWGDGTSQRYFNTTNIPTKTYSQHGVYIVTLDGLIPAIGFIGLGTPNQTNLGKIRKVLEWNDLVIFQALNMFMGCINLIEVPSTPPPLRTNLTMQGAFRDCFSFNQQLAWNFSTVTNYSSCFLNATSFNQNIGGWQLNTSLTNMTSMLNNCGMIEENYSRTLIGWANQVALNDGPINVTLGALGRTYSDYTYTTGGTYNDGVAARSYLVSRGWNITGDTRVDYLLDESNSFILLENNNKLISEGIL